jgi:hypothetical protein
MIYEKPEVTVQMFALFAIQTLGVKEPIDTEINRTNMNPLVATKTTSTLTAGWHL